MQGRRVDRALRRGHGRSRRLRLRQLRREKSQRLRLRHGHRPPRDAEVRHRRYSGLFPERRALPPAIPIGSMCRRRALARPAKFSYLVPRAVRRNRIMKVIYNWLKDFVDVTPPAQELASRLALSGTNIGGIEHGAHGAVIEAEVSSNRPDCLGHLGIAREVGAIYKLPLKSVSPKLPESGAKAGDAVKVEIQAPELCGRFTARVIRNVKIQPSPKWLKDRLEASGVASISNVVDVSNYVMLELGHPLHTFDYDKVRD